MNHFERFLRLQLGRLAHHAEDRQPSHTAPDIEIHHAVDRGEIDGAVGIERRRGDGVNAGSRSCEFISGTDPARPSGRHFGTSEHRSRRFYLRDEPMAGLAAGAVDPHLGEQAAAILVRTQAAPAVRERFRQHRDGAVREIDAVAADFR